ncbi:MAG: hypothetical protein RSE93_06925 [Oscillospiraceae bacterium]
MINTFNYTCIGVKSCLGIACPKKLVMNKTDTYCDFLRNEELIKV